MEAISQYATTLLSIFVSKYIDKMFSLDMSIKFALATAICGLIKAFILYLLPYIRNPYKKRQFIVETGTAIYTQLNNIIQETYPESILSQILSNNVLYISDVTKLTIDYNGTDVYITSGENNHLVLTSTCNIKDFIESIYVKENNTITIYTYSISGKFGNSSGVWKCTVEKSYKTIDNTFYAQNIHDTFIDNIDTFISSEYKYTQLGDTYATGYILHGPPGTGKTSLVKIIANMHDIPIFIINMQNTITTDIFIMMCDDLQNVTGKLQNYIILFEDFDRSQFISSVSIGRFPSISLEVFLNFLDGVQAAHGRITIITCNDITRFRNIPAMIRPGRIDSIVHIKICDEEQLIKTINFRYGVQVDDIPFVKIIPSCLVQLIKNVTFEEIIEIFNKYTDFEDIDVIINLYRNNKLPAVVKKSTYNLNNFDDFIQKTSLSIGTRPETLLSYNQTYKVRRLAAIELQIKEQIKRQKIIVKITDFLYKHPDDDKAQIYLDKLLELNRLDNINADDEH